MRIFFPITRLFAILALACLPVTASAQGADLAFGQNRVNANTPVEVEADNLAVSQNDGTAEFTGNVLIVQGEMRLSAPRVFVVYTDDESAIERLEATGGVTLVSGQDAAEAQRADYSVTSGTIVMTGDVLLVQGANTLNSQKMTVNLDTGQARMEGRVRTILKPGGN